MDGPIWVCPYAELAEIMQPGIGAFHDPAKDPQATAVFGATLRDLGIDAPLPQFLTVRLRIVGPVGEQNIAMAQGTEQVWALLPSCA